MAGARPWPPIKRRAYMETPPTLIHMSSNSATIDPVPCEMWHASLALRCRTAVRTTAESEYRPGMKGVSDMWGRSNEPPKPEAPAQLTGIPLPEPHPALVSPPGGDARDVEHLYFDPARWNSEIVNHLVSSPEDPIVTGRGMVEGQGTAAPLHQRHSPCRRSGGRRRFSRIAPPRGRRNRRPADRIFPVGRIPRRTFPVHRHLRTPASCAMCRSQFTPRYRPQRRRRQFPRIDRPRRHVRRSLPRPVLSGSRCAARASDGVLAARKSRLRRSVRPVAGR